jgi:membrane associated rhomboid family serine protease
VAHREGRLSAGRDVRFWLWAGLYFTTPFLIAAVWVLNQRHEDPTPVDDVAVSEPTALVIGSIGVLAALMSLFLFVFPQAAIALWPWLLTPLTARVMGGIFALGIAAIGVFLDRRWSAMRIQVQVEVLMLVLILVSGVRAAGDFDSANVLTWLFAGGFVGVLVASVVLYVRMEQRTRRLPERSV